MGKFNLSTNVNLFISVTVDAPTLEDAIELAYEKYNGHLFTITPDGCLKPAVDGLTIDDASDEYDKWENLTN